MAKLISVDMALELIAKTASPLAVKMATLKQANGCVLAQDMRAKVTLPPLDASAMDGYAVKLNSRHKISSVFRLIGDAPAGSPFDGIVGENETVRIFTGGAVPKNANHVIMQENVSANGNEITLTEPISKASHIRKAGIDFNENDLLLSKGAHIDAYAAALLAAANHARVPVRRAPVVALIANGDELVAPGRAVKSGQVISSNPSGLAPLLNSWGAKIINMGISKDEPSDIRAQILAAIAKGADILVPIGGASVGERDYMRSVFTEMTYKKVFEKVAVKPGKPVWFGTLNTNFVLGLPGNPASALVTAHVFLKPLIMALTGNANTPHPTVTARITQDLKPSTWRSEYIRAYAHVNAQGFLEVTPIPRQDSSLLTPFIKANCFLVRSANTPAIKSGQPVQIMLTKILQ